ncbi:thioredoxin domain-containing protein [Paenibacillus sp. HB172176]|uniref:DsbA family protein n=1 Tax=Paenibacillus sp. HB172176 TaxID=2493690 RepID=UPI0014390E17|nr:thioredoxin domain-containing protein [Paenibacillus sp. HB172176]
MSKGYKNNRSKKKDGSRYFVLYSAIIIVVIAGLVVVNQLSNDSGATNVTNIKEAPSTEGQPMMGNPESTVSIVEFGDFKCPYCKEWTATILPQLKKDYIDTNKVSFSYVNVLFHGNESILGSLAAEYILETNPDKYWEFHDLLFANQPDETSNAPWLTDDNLVAMAKQVVPDLDEEAFLKSVHDDITNPATEAGKQVQLDKNMDDELQLQYTPTLVVNDTEIANPLDYESIKKAIEKDLE